MSSRLKAYFLLTTVLTVITQPMAALAQFTAFHFKSSSSYNDVYPNRSATIENAKLICKELIQLELPDTTQAIKSIESHFLPHAVIQKITKEDNNSWTLDSTFLKKDKYFLRLIKDTHFFTFSLRQSIDSIEPIASVTFENDCVSFKSAKLTYYNSDFRPIRKVVVNANLNELRSTTIEEPVKYESNEFRQNLLRIGFIDSGLDYNHQAVISKSRPMIGLDLIDTNRPPYDYTNTYHNELMGTHFSHGTAVADIASKNISVLLVPARIENKSYLAGKAAEFLISKDVRLINISQGGTNESDWTALNDVILKNPEVIFVVSAGNESLNIDIEKTYPAGFKADNLIVIASVDENKKLSSFSNYGIDHVHFAAFGENITAAEAGGGFWKVNGTSFAAPLVTRLIAKMLIQNPNLTVAEIKSALIKKAVLNESLKGKILYGALVDE